MPIFIEISRIWYVRLKFFSLVDFQASKRECSQKGNRLSSFSRKEFTKCLLSREKIYLQYSYLLEYPSSQKFNFDKNNCTKLIEFFSKKNYRHVLSTRPREEDNFVIIKSYWDHKVQLYERESMQIIRPFRKREIRLIAAFTTPEKRPIGGSASKVVSIINLIAETTLHKKCHFNVEVQLILAEMHRSV